MRWSLALASFLALGGCPKDPTDDDASAPDATAGESDGGASMPGPRLDIGLGVTEFVEITSGSDAELIMGPQGGWHVNVAFRVYDLDPMDLVLRIRGYDDLTGDELTLPIERVLTSRRVTQAGDYFIRVGDLMIFMVMSAAEATGRDLRIEAEVEPPGGTPTSASLVVHVVDEE